MKKRSKNCKYIVIYRVGEPPWQHKTYRHLCIGGAAIYKYVYVIQVSIKQRKKEKKSKKQVEYQRLEQYIIIGLPRRAHLLQTQKQPCIQNVSQEQIRCRLIMPHEATKRQADTNCYSIPFEESSQFISIMKPTVVYKLNNSALT